MRKQVGLKFEEEDLARWDVFALGQDLTRTTLIEKAVENYMRQHGAPVTKHSEDELEKVDPEPEPESQTSEKNEKPRGKLDSYPSAPTDPKKRREHFAYRNSLLQGGDPATTGKQLVEHFEALRRP